MSKKNKEVVKTFDEVSKFKIFFNISKQTNKGYILYNVKSNTFIQNLSCWSIYDYWRKKSPCNLIKSLIAFINEREDAKLDYLLKMLKNIPETNKSLAETVLIDYEKDLYQAFQNLVSYKKYVVKDTDYRPINKLVYEKKGDSYLNLYLKGDEFKNIEPNINAKFEHIKRLVYNVCGNNDESYNYFVKFLAFKIQNPEILIPCHIIIRDSGGTGKTEILLSDILKRLFEVSIITQDDLMSSFNSYMVGSSFVWCEEVEGFNDEKKLKALTGAKYITLNEKFEKNKKVKNYNNFIIASNELRVLKIGENDRRFSVIGGGKRLNPNTPNNWGETIFKDKKECQTFFNSYRSNFDIEIKNFYSYLLALEVDRLDISTPLDNKEREDLINLNKPSEINFLDDLIELKLDGLYKSIYPNRDINVWRDLVITKNNPKEPTINGYWIRGQDIYELYLEYCKQNSYNKNLSHRMFSRRLEENRRYKEIFEDYRIIWLDEGEITARCFKFKTEKNLKK